MIISDFLKHFTDNIMDNKLEIYKKLKNKDI